MRDTHYVPIIKWKRGEQKALEFLNDKVRGSFTPLIEVVPMDDEGNVDGHLHDLIPQIVRSLKVDHPVFLDLYCIEEAGCMESGEHPLKHVLDIAREHEVRIIPVTGTSRNEEYQEEVVRAITNDNLGVCVRLEDEDFEDIEANLSEILSSLSIDESEVDLIIDMKYLSPSDENKNTIFVRNIINEIPHVERYRSLILCGTSYPENISSYIAADSFGIIPRSEWNIWNELNKKKDKIKRIPSFGDYTITHPEYLEYDPIYDVSAKLRYTSDSSYAIFRGRSVRRHTYSQMRNLCRELVTRGTIYKGQDYSWGDNYIYECANNIASTGNGETWVRVGVNHHITFVCDQLASLT